MQKKRKMGTKIKSRASSGSTGLNARKIHNDIKCEWSKLPINRQARSNVARDKHTSSIKTETGY